MKRLMYFFSLVLVCASAIAQPTQIEGTWLDGGGFNNNIGTISDRGTHRFFRQVTSGSDGTRVLLFNNPDDDYSPKWVASSTSSYTKNAFLTGGAVIDGCCDIHFDVVSGRYYTFVIGESTYASNNLSILETIYDPVNISSVTQNPSVVNYGQTVTVTINLESAINTGEYAYLRYSTDGFTSSDIVPFTMTGSSGTAIIPPQFSYPTVSYYVFTSNQSTAPSAAQVDYFSLNIFNANGLNPNGGTNFSYNVGKWTTQAGATNWSAGSSWVGGIAPAAATNMGEVLVNHAITMNQDNTVTKIDIGTDATLSVAAGNTLQIAGGISGPAGSLTINGTLQINASGFTNVLPNYGTNSLLRYSINAGYGRSNEWTSSADAGYPYNVQVSGTTVLDLVNGSPALTKQCAGSLTIDADAGVASGAMTGPLRVLGNININGTLSMSSALGGDLYVGGNWTRAAAGTFNPNGRAVFFNGTGTQLVAVTGGGTQNFDFLSVSTSAGSLTLSNSPATNVNVNANTGSPLQLFGNLDLNGQTLSITNTGVSISLGSGNRSVTSTIAGGVFSIDGSPGVVGLTATGTLQFGSNVIVSLSSGLNPINTTTTTLNGTLRINQGGYLDNSLTYGSSATLLYMSNSYGVYNEWVAGSTTGPGVPFNVTLNMNTLSSDVSYSTGSRTVPGNLTITKGVMKPNGTLNILGNVSIANEGLLDGTNVTVNVSGDWSANSAQTGNGYNAGTTGTLVFNGSGTRSISHVGGATCRTLSFTGVGTYTIGNDINAQTQYTQGNGIVDFGTNCLYGGGNMTMTGGTLRLARLSTTLPELTGTPYINSGGTIELNGAGTQTLRGGCDYFNLTFSNSGTKGVTSAPSSIAGTLTISDAVVLDAGSSSMGSESTNLTMSGTALFITANLGSQPSAAGTYSLSPTTTIEFAGSYTVNIRTSKTFANIVVSGTNVNNSALSTGISLQSGCTFTVKSGAIFKLNNTAGFTGSTSTAIDNTNSPTIILEPGSTIQYDHSGGSQTVTTGINYPNLSISGSSSTKTIAGDIIVNENLNLLGGTLEDDGNIISVTGNITGTATHTSTGSGKIIMLGSAASISGATLGNLELNNADGFSLSGSPSVTGVLEMTAGKLTLGSNNITLTNTDAAAVIGYEADKYFVTNSTGSLRRNVTTGTTYDFPVGTASAYNPATVETSDAFSATWLDALFSGTPLSAPSGSPAIDGTVMTGFLNSGSWTILPNATLSAGTYNLTLTSNSHSNASGLLVHHGILKSNDGGSTWAQPGTHVSPSTAIVTGSSDPITVSSTSNAAFSIFAIAFSNSTVLPIELVAFDATVIDADVHLTWETASEINNDYFIIERSMDGATWNPLGQISGAGTSTVPQWYEFIDEEAPAMVLYYRLKQVDYNGQFEYSEVRVVNNLGNESYIVLGYYNINGQWFDNLDNAPAGMYVLVSNKGNSKVIHMGSR